MSWQIILNRRNALREAFCGFQPEVVANFTESDVGNLMKNTAIIRNNRKIRSAINNAKRYKELKEEFGSLSAFFWQFEPDSHSRPKKITRKWLIDNPHTRESTQLAKDLKKRGWSFIGPTNMYALMQALGIVNDHVHQCPQQRKVESLRESIVRPQEKP